VSNITRARYRLYKRRNKFNAKPTEYKGIRYDSKMEATHAEILDKDMSVLWWLRQVGFDLTPDHRYRVDFLVAKTDGELYAVEVKGRVTAQSKKHFKLWKKYGIMPLHIVYAKKTEVINDGLEGLSP
jgi:DNA-binding sugar fermentation-stimulating protein